MTSLEYFNDDDLPTSVFNKYALDEKETPDEMHKRLAKEFARIEKKKFKKPFSEREIYDALKSFGYIIPQGSILSGLGNPNYVSLSNCYVAESPIDSYGGIHHTDEQVTQISKRRGGVGLDISNLRPNGFSTTNASRSSTGVVPFCERYSNSIREVGQAGRRGALMITISVHHPQIIDFTEMKLDPKMVTGANVSIRLTNEFLKAVKENKEYEQRFPVDSKKPEFSKMVNAREVWKKIIHCAWARAEPGLLFWDNVIDDSPADCYSEFGFKTVSTNPCCFNKDSNVYLLTNNGTKEIKDVTSNDLVWIDEKEKWEKTSGYFNSGLSEVFLVKLKNGESLEITNNHKLGFAKRYRDGTKHKYKLQLRQLSELSVGDKILLGSKTPTNINFGSLGNYEEGLCLGWLTGDGCLSYHGESSAYPNIILDFYEGKHECGYEVEKAIHDLGYSINLQDNNENNKKRISSELFVKDFTNKYQYNIWNFKSDTNRLQFLDNASEGFIKGFIKSYFAADCSVTVNHEAKSYCIQLSSINKERLHQIKYILLLFGIKSSVVFGRHGGPKDFEDKGGICETKDCWRLVIADVNSINKFTDTFGSINIKKARNLNEIKDVVLLREPKNSFYTEIISIESLGLKEVGCINVENEHSFTANGLISGNSELPLCELDSCRLLLLNLFMFVEKPFTRHAKFDFVKFEKYAKLAQRLMDDIIDLELEHIERIIFKICDDPQPKHIKQRELDLWQQIRDKCREGRRTGTGITALGDTIAAVGLKYGSDASIKLTDSIYKSLKLACYRSSVDIAKERGAFPIFKASLEKNNPFLLRIRDENPELYKDMQKYGRSNIACLTTAPAGSVSTMAGEGPYWGTTSGIEPLFTDVPYTRRKKINPSDKDVIPDFVDELGDKWKHFDVYHSKIKMWMDITGEKDYKKSPYWGATAEKIDWQARVKLQAAATKHIDHSISSTVNLPKDVTEEEVARIYETAWESGCKGITVYRDGCRSGVLVKKEDTERSSKDAKKRPTVLSCDIYHFKVKKQPFTVLVGIMDNAPYEVFAFHQNALNKLDVEKGFVHKIKRGKYELRDSLGENLFEGETLSAQLNDDEAAITRLVSTGLRHGAPLEFLVHQLEKSSGNMDSLSTAIARGLKKYLEEGSKVPGEECEQCKMAGLVRQEGCVKCPNCGWSKC